MHRFRIVLPLVATAALLNGAEIADLYHRRLQSFDATRPQSVCEARDALRESMSLANEDDRAAMFRVLPARLHKAS